MKKFVFISALMLMTYLSIVTCQAHMLWLNADNYAPKSGQPVFIEIGWGHGFPREQFISQGRLEEVYALTAQGKKIPLKEIFPSFYQFTPENDGAYRIVAALKSGFLSITTQGHQHGDRKTLSNVVSCFKYIMDAEAWVRVGEGKPEYFAEAGGPLKLMPASDLAAAKAGQTLPLKVVFQDKPLAGVKVTGTFAGRKADKDDHWAVEETTGQDGIARVKLESPGQWLFRVAHKTPYPDKSVADDYSYRTALTFMVR